MKKFHKWFLIVLILISAFPNAHIVEAQDEEFTIADVSKGLKDVIAVFDDETSAKSFYTSNKQNYDNLVLYHLDDVIDMEYGVVNFVKTENCAMNLTYTSLSNGTSAYLNACYVADAAFIKTSGDYVYFKISGDVGYTKLENVILKPFNLLKCRTSMYEIYDGVLYHNIKTSLEDDYYIYSIALDDNDEWINYDGYYYSYDGNYFYLDFNTMIDDYRSGSYEQAINYDNPYFNYYLYLPHRSYTNYDCKEVEDYFSDVLCFDGKIQFYDDLNLDSANDDVNLSQYYDEMKSFFGYESIYGANAMMMLSLSTLESSYGKSLLAFSKNNLFGHAAYDSDVERESSRYNNIDTSIYSHAKYYISRSYSGVHSSVYWGSFFGNKLSGMNVMYSSDPYWGEKCASNYYKYDADLGFKDKNTYALGIVENGKNLTVYKDKNMNSVAFSVNGIDVYSLILLEENEDSYKVQIDNCIDEDYKYNPVTNIGYVPKKKINTVINKEKISEKEYKEIKYDFGEGNLHGDNKIIINIPSTRKPCIPSPSRDGYEFNEYDYKNGTYVASYKKIKSIEVINDFPKVIEKDYFYNLKGGKIQVLYSNNYYQIMDIDSNMIESYDSSDESIDHLVINYNGVKTEYPIEFSSKLTEYRNEIDKRIEKTKGSYYKDGSYDLADCNYIKANMYQVDYLLGFDEIRLIDKLLLNDTRNKVNYHFVKSNYDISISGLALALEDPRNPTSYKPFKDTYYIRSNPISNAAKKRLKKVANAYGFDVVDSLNVSVSLNLKEAEFENPIVIQIKVLDKELDKIYTVYHLDKDGNVIKCRTIQSKNYVSFITRSSGDFMILSKDSVNKYDIDDAYENLSKEDNDPDVHSLFLEGCVILFVGLYGFIMIILYKIINKESGKKWNVYKR